jgi:hypothetical protein
MKTVLRMIVLASTLPLVGCLGWGDFKKLPPGPQRVWSQPGKTVEEMFVDRQACSDKFRPEGNSTIGRQHFVEACMLEKGYIFTNYRSRDTGDYCSKNNWGGGPACKSVGR